MPILLYPHSRGSLRLRSADPTEHPDIDPGFLTDPRDMEVLVHGVKQSREIAATAPMSDFVLSEAFPGPQARSDDAIRAHVRLAGKTVYHPVGSCKMGTDTDAVVAPDLKVHGLEGLRVCDSSIMPRLVSSNTNAPTIMIGEKAADLIRGVVDRPASEPETLRAVLGD